MAINSMGMVYVFLSLSWTVPPPTLLSQVLRNCWDVCLEIKVDWNAGQSFMREMCSTVRKKKKKSCVFVFFVRNVSVYMLVSVTTGINHLQKLRSSNGCLSMGLENTYCLFYKVTRNIVIEGWDRHYFPPPPPPPIFQDTQQELCILKLNEANCWQP